MKNTILIVFSVLTASLFSACCGDCNGAFLGTFLIKEDSKAWVSYADNNARIFKGPGNQTAIFSYSFPSFFVNPDVFNCETDDCGTCCDNFEIETTTFSMNSDDINVTFVFSLQPNFISNTPLDPPAEISDFLTIAMNNKLFTDVFMDNIILKDRVTVNGQEYRNIVAAELDRATLDTTSRDPWAFYLLKEKGIVAYKLANGEEWNLAE